MVAYYAKLYLATLFAFLLIDGIWLGLVARGFYGRYLGYLLRPSPNWFAAVLFYLLFVAGIVLFVVVPASHHESWKRAIVCGAVFGLVTYATYDLTNLATIRDWPLVVTVVDLAWGTSIGAVVSYIAFCAGRWFG
jgi:uncharacterized membrane protein